MAPGHYRASNISNPFNNYPPAHNAHAGAYPQPPGGSNTYNSHLQQQNHNGPGNGFPNSNQNGNVSLFGGASGLSNGGNGGFGNGTTMGLGNEAQMGFERAAALQRQQQQQAQGQNQDMLGSVPGSISRGSVRIREVWKGNLDVEMNMIRNLIIKYPYVSMDTEFPGVVARPFGDFPNKVDLHYQTLRCNIDILKLIQLGITLFSSEGELPPLQAETPSNQNSYSNNLTRCPCTWTFNFKFSLTEDMYSQASIDMLQTAGVDFQKTEEIGIDPQRFGSLLISSGLVLDQNVSWLSFHSGYDFGYLIKVMTQKMLPKEEKEYMQLLRKWFPRIYDIKFLVRHTQGKGNRGILNTQASEFVQALGPRSGLADIATELGVQREGRPHTAGSDAWLTGSVFWQLKEKVFDQNIPDEMLGMIWGLNGVGPPASAASRAAAIAGQQTPHTNGANLYQAGMTPALPPTSSRGDLPSTPQTSNSGLASTPGAHGFGAHGSGMAGLATGGAFPSFTYGGR